VGRRKKNKVGKKIKTMQVACRCLLIVLVLPQLLALSWCDNAALLRPLGILHRGMVARGRSSATSDMKLHLRGGSGDVGTDGAAVGDQEEDKTSELPKHVNMELGETEAVVREKQAIDETCDELHAKKEKGQAQLAKQEAALLLAAAKAGDTQSLQDILVHGVEWLGVMDEDGMNALHHAAAGGHQDTINSLLERDSSGSSLAARANDGSSALHLASYYGFDAAVELLLARGADVHAVDVEGSTALHNAAYKGNSDIVSLLIKAGANVNQQQVMHIVLAYMHAQIRMHAACIKSETRRACIQGGWGTTMCPHTTLYIPSYYYICVLILRPHSCEHIYMYQLYIPLTYTDEGRLDCTASCRDVGRHRGGLAAASSRRRQISPEHRRQKRGRYRARAPANTRPGIPMPSNTLAELSVACRHMPLTKPLVEFRHRDA
jgi:hypothetical protein